MSRQNQSSFLRTLAASVIAFGAAAFLLLPVSPMVTDSRVLTTALAEKSGNSARRSSIAKLEASDSSDGSRVRLTSDQSLNNYEAFRRGDRFFLKIPRASLPHLDGLRARAFDDVRVERAADATFLVFHLFPGVTARIEQWGNNLEIVFAVSRARVITSTRVAPAVVQRNSRATAPRLAAKDPVTTSKIRATATTATGSKASNSVKRPANEVSEDRRTSTIVLPAANVRLSPETESMAAVKQRQTRSQASITTSEPSESAVSSQAAERETASRNPVSSVPIAGSQTNTWNNIAAIVVGAAILLVFFGLMLRHKRGARQTLHAKSLMQPDISESFVHDCVTAEPNSLAQHEVVSATEQEEYETVLCGTGTPGGKALVLGKLVLDNAHRADVMGARSPEDRKAIEASLINVITAPDIKPEDRRRARATLDEYGFVARHCATLLTGRDAWERSAAARKLAQIASRSSLPFLIEALHDDDSVVRNQAVASLAMLKDPKAIGALLQASRTHPDVPASLLSEALSACSVDTLAPLDEPSTETALLDVLTARDEADAVHQELFPTGDDDLLSELLAELESRDETLTPPTDLQLPFNERHERPYLTLVA